VESSIVLTINGSTPMYGQFEPPMDARPLLGDERSMLKSHSPVRKKQGSQLSFSKTMCSAVGCVGQGTYRVKIRGIKS
jgi:hypothetical protein